MTIAEINAGLKSRREAVAERGRDLEDFDTEIARNRASAAALGLEFTVDVKPQRDMTQ